MWIIVISQTKLTANQSNQSIPDTGPIEKSFRQDNLNRFPVEKDTLAIEMRKLLS